MTLANTWPVIAALAIAGWGTVVCLWRENSRLLYSLYQAAEEAAVLAAKLPAKTVTAIGTMTGDGECWCLEVDEENYRRVAGERFWQLEKELAAQEAAETGTHVPPCWRLYPNDLVRAAAGNDEIPEEPVELWLGLREVDRDARC